MNAEVISTYFKWGHKKNRAGLTFLITVILLSTLIIQSVPLYDLLFSDTLQNKDEHVSKVVKESPPLKEKDFQLLFGFSNKSDQPKATNEIPKTRLNLILRGALGYQEKNNHIASAIIQGNSQDKLYVIGETLPGGAVLKEVHVDHVILNRGGQLETLYFPDAGKDTRALQEYKKTNDSMDRKANQPGFTKEPDGKSLEQRMQDLRDKLQQANQGI